MAQTTDGITAVDMTLELSTNGTAWTDVSGFSTSVEPDGGARKVGETHTLEGDTPIISKGKRESIDLKCKIVYTEGAADAFAMVQAAYDANTPLYARYSPKGGGSGSKMYTSGPGIVTECPYPAGEAESEDLILVEFTLKVATLTQSTVV